MIKAYHQFDDDGNLVAVVKNNNALPPEIDGTDVAHQIEHDGVFDHPVKYDKVNKKIVPHKEVNKGTEEIPDWQYEKDTSKPEIAVAAKKLKTRKD